MITVHHLGVSQSERIIWLCEELGIPYTLDRHDRDAETRLAPVSYKKLHPLGTAPIITDGDQVLAESGAIIEYIIRKHGGGRLAVPPEDPAFADYVFWYHFANGSMMPNMMMGLIVAISGGSDSHPIIKSLLNRTTQGLALIEQRLGKVPYFAGDRFTAADIIMLFPLSTMRAFSPVDLTQYPNLKAYLARIGERPAYRRAMAKGDPEMPPMLA